MKKRCISFLLALVFALGLLPAVAFGADVVDSGSCGENVTWTLDSDGVLTISGTGEISDYDYDDTDRYDNPWHEVDGEIIDLVINDGITSIGKGSFSDCHDLESVSIPSSVTSIGEDAFAWCFCLSHISIPSGVESIGDYAFWNCYKLTSIYISESVTDIGVDVFRFCDSLTSIDVADSNSEFSSVNGVLFNKDQTELLCCPGGKTGQYIVPSGTTSIECMAFADCEKLTSIAIPDSVTDIDNTAFYDCSGLTSIQVDSQNSDYSSEDGVLFDKNKSILVCCPGGKGRTYSVPSGVTCIEENAFCDSSLTSVSIPSSVTNIGWCAFVGCDSLSDVYYSGTEEQWQAISIGKYNECLTGANIHYNWKGSANANGLSALFTKLYVTDLSPNCQCCEVGAPLKMKFNYNVEAAEGMIHIYNIDQNKLVESISVQDPRVVISGSLVTVTPDDSLYQYSRSYYVTVDNGAFYSEVSDSLTQNKDKLCFHGINKKDTWTFETNGRPAPSDFPVSYAKKTLTFWSDDTSKPPIPNGSDEDYVTELLKWLHNAGVDNVSRDTARAWLSDPVRMPVKTHNTADSSPILLWDGGTRVKQVMSDLIFVDYLQAYLYDADVSLSKVERSSKSIKTLYAETEICNDIISWYGQISKYIKGRSANSNFMVSVASPLANAANIQLIKSTTGDYYTYIKPLVSATLKEYENAQAMQSLQNTADYAEFKAASERLNTVISGGKAVYKVATEQGVTSLVEFGADLLCGIVKESGNSFAREFSDSYSTIKDVKNAVTLSMAVGSTIGMFPMVVDLYDTLMRANEEQTRTLYFLSDYYISVHYPELYKQVYADGTFFPTPDNSLLGAYPYHYIVEKASLNPDDAVLYNWTRMFYQAPGLEPSQRDKFLSLRKELSNYATLLNFVKSVDVEQAKLDLAKYVSAYGSDRTVSQDGKNHTVTVTYIKCPVRINVYAADDDAHVNLLGSLSSEDETIQSVEYGSFYLLGEDNETKCFIYDPAMYQVEFVPYDEGTMKVTVLNTDPEGNVTGKYFEDVTLESGSVFSTDVLNMDEGLIKTFEGNSVEIEQTESVPTSGLNLTGPNTLAVGQTDQMSAEILPATATDRTVIWRSSDNSVLNVSADGMVTARGAGSATITAETASGQSSEQTIEVYIPITELSVAVAGETVEMLAGETFVPGITASSKADLSRVQWYTSNPIAAEVSSDGEVKALGSGWTVITGMVDGIEISYSVHVYDGPLQVTLYQTDTQGDRIKLDLENHSLQTTFNQHVTTAIYDTDGRMIKVFLDDPTIGAGDSAALYYPMDGLTQGKKYVVKTFVIDQEGVPMQINAEGILIQD